MKICVICLDWKGGGMIHYASQLANSLSENNEVYMITPECMEDRSYFKEEVSVLSVPIPPKNRISLKWFRIDTIVRLIKNINPDVIHITIQHPLLIPTLAPLRRYPFVFTCHDVKRHPGDSELFVYTYLFSLALYILKRSVNRVIVHGEKLKKELINETISANKIESIPHGDYLFFTKYRKEGTEEKNAVLFFGRIVKYKGIEYLIKAEPFITKQVPDTKIIIAGKGDFSKYEYLIEHKKNFVIYNRFIPDKQVAKLFQRSKVVVLPYIEASQSGIIPIAYAFKKPVVVTDVGSIPEVVDDGLTGFIVSPKNPKALAGAIIKLLKDEKLRKRMGENAYKKLKTDLSWDKIAEKTIEVYEKAINEHKKGG